MQKRMRQMSLFAVVGVAFVVVLGGTAFAQSDRTLGTWKVNLAKSKFEPGPPPMSDTRVIEALETNGVKFTATVIAQDGTHATIGFSAHYDGKGYMVTGTPDVDIIVLKRVNANAFTFALKKGGKVVQTGKYVVSKSGRMITLIGTGSNSKGQKVHDVLVMDKQ
jgi:hypothetical protein